MRCSLSLTAGSRVRDTATDQARTGVSTPHLLTKRQAADYLQVSLPTINNYVRRGLLRAYKLPGRRLVRIKREDLLALLEEMLG
ncbi:MAG: hypothetical protein C4345_05155 [Chloroflexota bacterium]